MSSIKNVVLAGASGSLGSLVLEKLVSAGEFNVTVLRRPGSKSTFPAGIKVVDVDHSSVESLTSALKGQDAVVNTIGSIELDQNLPLIEAAFAAGVKRFIPSEYGPNLDIPESHSLPIYHSKHQIRDLLVEKSKKNPSFTYTFMCTMAFLDWGLERNIFVNFKTHTAMFVGTGDELFSATTLASIGDAVVGVLRKPDETKNRTVFVEDIKLSLNKILALAKATEPTASWKVSYENLDELVAGADARLAKGDFSMETLFPYILKGTFGPGMKGSHEKTDNELLGVKGVTEEEVFEMIKKIVN